MWGGGCSRAIDGPAQASSSRGEIGLLALNSWGISGNGRWNRESQVETTAF